MSTVSDGEGRGSSLRTVGSGYETRGGGGGS